MVHFLFQPLETTVSEQHTLTLFHLLLLYLSGYMKYCQRKTPKKIVTIINNHYTAHEGKYAAGLILTYLD